MLKKAAVFKKMGVFMYEAAELPVVVEASFRRMTH
jgi:hypothetical protein